MSDHDEQSEPQGPTVRDRRRIDPETFEVREPQSAAAPGPEAPAGAATSPGPDGPAGEDEQVQQLQTALAERTADLQRLQAEYVNYKRRVDRDRDLTRKVALEGFVKDLLPVLDDVRSAREHGELTGAFKAVAEEVERITAKHGLRASAPRATRSTRTSTRPSCRSRPRGSTARRASRSCSRATGSATGSLRPARVAVAEPVEGSAAPSADDAGAPAADAEQ